MTATILASGRRTLELEAQALARAAAALDGRFAEAVALLHGGAGRVIVSGVGKSGLVARKIAATLTSTGTAATFLHPVESLHGDLGLVTSSDVAIVVSKSGDADELLGLVAALQRMAVPIIAITADAGSPLGGAATVVLDGSVSEEACPHDLAPTASTTVAMALGDALAVALLEVKGFSREDFAALHPGGRLGRKLLLRVRDVMVAPGPLLSPDATMREVLITLAQHRGLAMIGTGHRLAGVVTAGDISRLVERGQDVLAAAAASVMTATPRATSADALAAQVTGQMERHGIMAMPVLDQERAVVGVVHLHDLMRAGAV